MHLFTSNYWRIVIHVFLVNVVLFIPFPYFLFRYQLHISHFLFSWLIRLFSGLQDEPIVQVVLHSDTAAMYWLVLILFILSVVLSFVLLLFHFFIYKAELILWYLRKILLYFLILHLAKYGADKIFLNQFYTPEANILFTPFGNLDRDILYWSVMGLSPGYSIFLGASEVITALLLCFKKTRTAGLFLAAGILVNVVAINFGFDISVKIFSLLLLSITCLLLLERHNHQPLLKKYYSAYLSHTFRWLLFFLLLVEIFYPLYLNKTQAAIPFRGAYEVLSDSNATNDLKRFFIHKDGYLIFQDSLDKFSDQRMYIDTAQQTFLLTNYDDQQTKVSYDWRQQDSILTLFFPETEKQNPIIGKQITLENMPALRKNFYHSD